MKTKKIVSLLLAIIMLVSVFPMSAIAQGLNNAYATVKGNSYTDPNSLPDESYQYTVKGPDGRAQTITLLGKNAVTGNTIKEIPMYYVRVLKPENRRGEMKGVLLVTDTNKAVKHDRFLRDVTPTAEDKIEGNFIDGEWFVNQKASDDKIYVSIKNADGIYIGVEANKDTSWLTLKPNYIEWELNYKSKHGNTHNIPENYVKFARYTYTHTFWGLDYYDYKFLHIGTLEGKPALVTLGDEPKNAMKFKYYQKVVDADQDTLFLVETTGIEKAIADAKVRVPEVEYPSYDNSINRFKAALHEAQASRDAVKDPNTTDRYFLTKADAEAAQERIDRAQIELNNSIAALKYQFSDGEEITPVITWERTLENPGDFGGSLARELSLFNGDDYSKIVWDWTKVKDLPLDMGTKHPTWDYNTDGSNGQISGAAKVGNITAATWRDHFADGKVDIGDEKHHPGYWKTGSVRRFSGTFTWPYGYTLNDKAFVSSVNDANYKPIYDYINANPELKARYGNSKVIAVNDDIYVFISRADEQPSDWKTTSDAMRHLAFWTGTDGKGIWSMVGNTDGDSGRTTPATYNGRPATPAYNNAWPNLEDRPGGSNANVKSFNKFPNEAKYGANQNKDTGLADKMKFSGGWYTLTDTSGVMSTLTGLYGSSANLDGQKMRIEVFAMDNAGDGGMDKLQLTLKKPDATDIKVTVDYYLEANGRKINLNCPQYFFAKDGSTYSLSTGTNGGELNYAKEIASQTAGEGATVSDGVQTEKPFVVTKNHNVIEVVYKADKITQKYLTFDFAGTNNLVYDFGQAYKTVGVETTANISVSKGEGNLINITYAPDTSKTIGAAAKLKVVDMSGATKTVPIYIIPASNVLYEENFMRTEPFMNSANWTKTPNTIGVISDNEKTVFGYSDAYINSKGNNGIWKTTLAASGDKQFSDDLVFGFTGRGFDVIGEVGPNTGSIMVSVRDQKQANKVIRNYLVDTRYSKGTLYQVPLVHCDDLPGGDYTVRISAANIEYSAPAARSAYSLKNAAPSANERAYLAMLKMGLTDEEIANTEFIEMENTVSASSYALRNAAPEAKATTEKTVSIDAFRVYRNTTGAENAYPEDEQNVTYTNILNVADKNSKFTAYMENNSGKFNIADYRKNGGPAGEIYLPAGAAIAIKTSGNANGVAHVSVRAVSADTVMSINDVQQNITHHTEMYYDTQVKDGLVVIVNKGKSMLAIDNVKSKVDSLADSDVKTAQVMAARMMAAPIIPEKVTFAPARFDIKLNVIKTLFNQYATLKVKTSDDVAYITVNGVRVDSNNVNLHKWGIHDYMRFTLRKTFKKDDAILFEVVAYDKNGNASDPIIKK